MQITEPSTKLVKSLLCFYFFIKSENDYICSNIGEKIASKHQIKTTRKTQP